MDSISMVKHENSANMKVQKAVITAAGPGQNMLPLQQVVDQLGQDRTALQLILDEAVQAGIEDICVVVCPGDVPSYRRAAGEHANYLTFVEQDNPRGYGDALFRAAKFVGDDPFLHLVGDHLYISQTKTSCARQLVEAAEAEACAVSAVQPTREDQLRLFGTVGATRVPTRNDLYEVSKVVEKPTPTLAEQDLGIAGLRASYYLCMFGLHVLTPMVMEILDAQIRTAGVDEQVLLTPALTQLAQRERYFALQVQGNRYNIGVKYGLLMAQLALSLSGTDRDQIMTELLGLVMGNTQDRMAQ